MSLLIDLNVSPQSYAADGTVRTHVNSGPYSTLHVYTSVDLLVALDEDPTQSGSFLLPSDMSAKFAVPPGAGLRFKKADGSSDGSVKITALGID